MLLTFSYMRITTLLFLYRFLRNPTELKNIKNISLLRQQMSPTNTKNAAAPSQLSIKPEPVEEQNGDQSNQQKSMDFDEKPTDLSMDGPTDLSSSSRHSSVNIVCSPDPPIVGPHHWDCAFNSDFFGANNYYFIIIFLFWKTRANSDFSLYIVFLEFI